MSQVKKANEYKIGEKVELTDVVRAYRREIPRGTIGVVSQVPADPSGWIEIQFPDGPMTTVADRIRSVS